MTLPLSEHRQVVVVVTVLDTLSEMLAFYFFLTAMRNKIKSVILSYHTPPTLARKPSWVEQLKKLITKKHRVKIKKKRFFLFYVV